jgi:hypothetical protein
LKIHQFSHNHGKLKCSSYYLYSLGNFFCHHHILCLLLNLQLRNCEDILQQQAASRDVYFIVESFTHWRHIYRLQKEAHHQNRIPSQRETYQTPSRFIRGCSGFHDLNRLQLLPQSVWLGMFIPEFH